MIILVTPESYLPFPQPTENVFDLFSKLTCFLTVRLTFNLTWPLNPYLAFELIKQNEQ